MNDHALPINTRKGKLQLQRDLINHPWAILGNWRTWPQYSYGIDRLEKETEDGRMKNEIYQYWIRSARTNVINIYALCRLQHHLTFVAYKHDLLVGMAETISNLIKNNPDALNGANLILRTGSHTEPLLEPHILATKLKKIIE